MPHGILQLDALWWSIVTAITARMASGLIVNNDAFTDLEREELKRGIRKIVEYIERGKELHEANPQS